MGSAIVMQASEDIRLSPQGQLVREWRMFEAVESGGAPGLYAIWEANRPIVVLGRNNRADEWLDAAACRRDHVDVLRRASGGGAVVLAPGCVNYAVALPVVSRPALADISWSFHLVLHHVVVALGVPGLRIAGSDLVLGDRKVSGNAQRRGRRALLHHGTVLFDFDPQLAVRYLNEPPRQPGYRGGRRHEDFLGNLPISRTSTVAAVQRACESVVVRDLPQTDTA